MARVFISYSRKDKAVAQFIASELHNRGADVFIDYDLLIPGQNFIGRLGREILSSDYIVLLLSASSVESEWVKDEIAWGLHNRKPIIPVVLEPVTMVDFFFLVKVEQIDFNGWTPDRQFDEKVAKLAIALDLPLIPIRKGTHPLYMPEDEPLPHQHEKKNVSFTSEELADLFINAVDIAPDDPERAIFLYRRILEIDPDYARGQAQAFLQLEEKRRKPARLMLMLEQAHQAIQSEEWTLGEQIGRDMLELESDNKDAHYIVNLCVRNSKCESLYKHAIVAAQKGHWTAVENFMYYISSTCPEYGDPKHILRKRFIRPKLANHICEITTLVGHTHEVRSVAFSSQNSLLASGSFDKTVRLWDIFEQKELLILNGHTGYVRAVAFSPNGLLLASGSTDHTIKLWEVPTGHLLNTLEHHTEPIYGLAFSPDGSLLASASFDMSVKLWAIPSTNLISTLRGHRGYVRAVEFSSDGKVLVSASTDGSVKLWQIPDGQNINTLAHVQRE